MTNRIRIVWVGRHVKDHLILTTLSWAIVIIKHQPNYKNSFIEINKTTRVIKQDLSSHRKKNNPPFIRFLIFRDIDFQVYVIIAL